MYGDTQEKVPENMLTPKGKPVRITAFCDANLYHDETTGRAVSGIILLLNKTPIDWTSKRQATVEMATVKMATFGSEIIASRITVDQIVEWRYTLRMLGVPSADKGGHPIFLEITNQFWTHAVYLSTI